MASLSSINDFYAGLVIKCNEEVFLNRKQKARQIKECQEAIEIRENKNVVALRDYYLNYLKDTTIKHHVNSDIYRRVIYRFFGLVIQRLLKGEIFYFSFGQFVISKELRKKPTLSFGLTNIERQRTGDNSILVYDNSEFVYVIRLLKNRYNKTVKYFTFHCDKRFGTLIPKYGDAIGFLYKTIIKN